MVVKIKTKPPTIYEIEVMQKYYDQGFSVEKTGKKYGWSKSCLLKYIKVKHPVISDEERRKRKVEKVVSWRQRTKKKLVEYKGGKCIICGYNKCIRSLIFHHRNPAEKEFSITGKTISFEKLKKEVDKCDLLCSNCHGEEHEKLEKNLILV